MNMNPYLGFIKAVNFKSFFINYIYMQAVQRFKGENINKYDFQENHAMPFSRINESLMML